MRLFVAIALDEGIRAAIVDVMERLRPSAPRLKWVRPDSLHLTLKFIGSVEDNQIENMKAALRTARVDSPAALEFTGLFWVPNPRRPAVFWAGVKQCDILADLAGQIERTLRPFGVEPENRPFRPHLTLARFRRGQSEEAATLLQAVGSLASTDFGRMQAEEFLLMESQLSPGGAKYTRLERFGFVRPA